MGRAGKAPEACLSGNVLSKTVVYRVRRRTRTAVSKQSPGPWGHRQAYLLACLPGTLLLPPKWGLGNDP